MRKLSIIPLILAIILVLPLTSAYYGGYLGGDGPEQEYTTYTVSKNSPYDSYDKTYTTSSQQTPGGEITTKSYTVLDQNAGWGSYPSTTYKTYTSTKTSGWGYTPYNNYYKQPQIKTVYIAPTNNRYQDRSCSYWRCQPDYAPQYYKYSNNYLDDYYYSPHYDSNLGHYNWRY